MTGGNTPATRSELLTSQFYAWERRGRGWQVWDSPVVLEPPFRPFLFHYTLPATPPVDDGRRPTLLSSLWETLRRRRPTEDLTVFSSDIESLEREPEPEAVMEDSDLVELAVSTPPSLEISRDAMEQFLLSLTYAACPVALEVIGEAGGISVQVVSCEDDRREVERQLVGHFPEAVIIERTKYLSSRWDRETTKESLIVDFGLSHEFMRPLRTFKRFDVDPMIAVAGALDDLRSGEVALLQILFQATRHPWAESVLRAVTDGEGRSFFADAPEMVKLAQEKVSRPLFAAVIRVAVQSPFFGRASEIVRPLGGALRSYSSPTINELIPLSNDGYAESDHQEDLLLRLSRRSGMILNSEELVSLVHLPSASVRAEKLQREDRVTKAAPAIALDKGLILGENVHAGKTVQVALSPDQRVRHMYVIGASGTGKSTLLLNLILQDIRNGEGIGVLDPHGDLIDQILGHIPEERFKDIVLVDPGDADFPVGFNILSAHSELEKNLIASDLVAGFRRLSTSWGDQMTSVLGNAVLAFLESERGGTLADLRRFLIEPEFRRQFLTTVRDPEVVYYWQREFSLLAGKPQAPLLTRLDTFLRPKVIRHMVSQKENRLDFAGMMNQGKIFLAKLAQGAIGEENAFLLGTLLVSKFQQLAMSRQETAESERRPFYLYIDEFQNFITPSMAAILAAARKYRLGLILAHQDLRQLSKDPDLFGAIMSNPYTRICFRVGDQDAKKLAEGFSTFDAKDLQNQGTGEALCRMERAEYDFNLKTPPLPAVDLALARERRERVVALSRHKYATPRAEIEALLRQGAPAAEPAPIKEEESRPRRREPEPAAPAISRPTEPPPATHAIPRSVQVPSAGRGGAQHKYLQELIRRWAETRGWRVEIEKQVLDGLGSVDIALAKGQMRVACEITVTTSPEHELGNVQKCLASGFEQVIVVSPERQILNKVRARITSGLDAKLAERVRFFTVEELFSFLEDLEAHAATKEQHLLGYKVRTEHQAMAPEDQKARRRAVSEVILGALKRLRGKE